MMTARRFDPISETYRTPDVVTIRRGWFVYRLLDSSGTVLYIGMTNRLHARLGQHLDMQYSEPIAFCDVTSCSTAAEARELEADLIYAHPTPHNIMGRRRQHHTEPKPQRAMKLKHK